jgi:hypothetical protein
MNTSMQHFFDSLQSSKNIRYLGILAGAGVVGVAGYGVYYYVTMKKSQKAQKALAESSEAFTKALQSEGKDVRWDDVHRAFQTAYDRYGSTWAGPYLLAYQADAYAYEGKLNEALAEMTKALSSLKKSSPVYAFYATKLALMKVDSTDSAVSQAGLKELDALAEDVRNPDRERALYYAGYFAERHGDLKKARASWSAIVQRGAPDSVWVPAAKKKLDSL